MFPHRRAAVRSKDSLKGRGCFNLVFEYRFFFGGELFTYLNIFFGLYGYVSESEGYINLIL